jgi:hypothetical protein
MRRASGGIGVIDTAAVMLCLAGACDVENDHVGHSRDIRGYLTFAGK